MKRQVAGVDSQESQVCVGRHSWVQPLTRPLQEIPLTYTRPMWAHRRLPQASGSNDFVSSTPRHGTEN